MGINIGLEDCISRDSELVCSGLTVTSFECTRSIRSHLDERDIPCEKDFVFFNSVKQLKRSRICARSMRSMSPIFLHFLHPSLQGPA
jgi:hypothetical protein